MEIVSVFHRSLRILYRCVQQWRFWPGLRTWWALNTTLWGKPGAPPRRVWVPELPDPVWLRPGTSDVAVFDDIFLKRALDGASYPQHAVVAAQAQAAGEAAVILDGGANIGLASVWLTRAYPRAKILAVEPDPGNVAMLRRNTAAFRNVTVIEGALWDRRTSLSILNPDDEAWAYRVGQRAAAPASRPVAAYAIGDLMTMVNADEILIAKLIIQGAEQAVFAGNLDWLARTRLVIFMPNDWAAPWSGAGRVAMAALSAEAFDWIVRGMCVFCYRDPASMPATAK
jgi:FkbM family methyltransferase